VVERIKSVAQRAQDSLFFIPVIGILVFSGLAILVLYLDRRLTGGEGKNTLLLSATVAGGRSIATTVAGATITVAAIAFSITALSSQIAANQYSPRAVRGFFEDSFQQVVIAFIVGTFTYSLLILGGLSTTSAGASQPTPSIAVTTNVVLGVLSAIGIVAYIDHSLRRFQVDSVVRRISKATLTAVKKQNRIPRSPDHNAAPPEGESAAIEADRWGWIQGIEAVRIAEALPRNSSVQIKFRLGEHVIQGDELATVWPASAAPSVTEVLRKRIAIGKDRSLDDDPAFGIRQLVDIALKALSPGINDPTTARDVVHHLKLPVREILISEPPDRIFNGSDGQRVYLSEALSRSDFVHAAFAEIRINSATQPSVLSALLEAIEDLRGPLEHMDLDGRMGALNQEWDLTIDSVLSSGLPEADIKRVLGKREKTRPGEETMGP
jgi:uncharacterized membrane protein